MARKRFGVGVLITVLFLFPGLLPPRPAAAAGPTIIYVDTQASGNNDGTSWADAYENLAAALILAGSGTEIWVAQGTHKPGWARFHTFTLKNGVALYGGFPTGGGDGTFDTRAPDWYETILSGDLGVTGDNSDNSYHVVVASGTDATSILDGFTIRDGNADVFGDPKGNGGGIHNEGGSPTLENLHITGNYAWVGGGMYNFNGDPTLTSMDFEGNEAGDGAGMYSYWGDPALTNVRFEQNDATDRGGGLYNHKSDLILEHVTFLHNKADDGGGLYNRDSDPVLADVVFELNEAVSSGGGLYDLFSRAALVDVLFTRNSAQLSGGGAFVASSKATFTGARFEGNTAARSGGGMSLNTYQSVALANVALSGNHARDGGGLSCSGNGNISLIGVTISGNTAAEEGGGVMIDSLTASFDNTILWGNSAAQGDQLFNDGGTVTLAHSLVQGGCPAGATCPGDLLESDPMFVRNPDPGADGVWGTDDDDYGTLGLKRDSPAIDAGDNEAVPADEQDVDGDGNTTEKLPVDLAGNPRFSNAESGFDSALGSGLDSVLESALDSGALIFDITNLVDLGAYEAPPSPLYVDRSAGGANSGLSWANAFTDLQDALQRGRSGALDVWMAEGTYVPGVQREDTFQLLSGVAVYGGFPAGGGDGTFTARAWQTYTTTLSGEHGGQDENNRHVVTADGVDRSAVLDGLTISGGNADWTGIQAGRWADGSPLAADESCATNSRRGGGLCNVGGSPTLRHLVFRDNGGSSGGAIYNRSGQPLLDDVVLIENSAGSGGGISNSDGSPLLTNVVLRRNRADSGGGMANWGLSHPTLINVRFEGNRAGFRGGGLSTDGEGSLALTNVAFSGNWAEDLGGGMDIVGSGAVTLTNVTLAGNAAGVEGGGLFSEDSSPVLANAILWGNTAPAGAQMFNQDSTVRLDYSLVQGGCPTGATCNELSTGYSQFLREPDPGAGGTWGTEDDDYGDLRLAETSPAVDAGDNDAVPADHADLDGDGDTIEMLPLDLGGGRRFADLGSMPDAGNGSPPIVDRGAYEVQDNRVFLPLVMRAH